MWIWTKYKQHKTDKGEDQNIQRQVRKYHF